MPCESTVTYRPDLKPALLPPSGPDPIVPFDPARTVSRPARESKEISPNAVIQLLGFVSRESVTFSQLALSFTPGMNSTLAFSALSTSGHGGSACTLGSLPGCSPAAGPPAGSLMQWS